MKNKKLKLIECPRDAMQGLKEFIPTDLKVSYLNQLLKVGFDTLDFGSFVSPKAIPQLKDTKEVLKKLETSASQTKLLAIVANLRGAKEASGFEQVSYLGYPFSVSETFQKRNTNASIEKSKVRLEEIQQICSKSNKELVVYLSMGFGNPYGDPYHEDILSDYLEQLSQMDIKIFALSDTIGIAKPDLLKRVFSAIIPEFPALEIGAHLHTTPDSWREKVAAAYSGGCTRFDGAIAGFGGCPMATDELTGNMATESLVSYFEEELQGNMVNKGAFEKARVMANEVFPL